MILLLIVFLIAVCVHCVSTKKELKWPNQDSFFTFHFDFQSNIKVEQLPSPRSLCAEGPHWDAVSQSLYYIDICGGDATLLRYDFRENRTYAANIDGEPLITFILPVIETTDKFLVGTKRAAKIIRWDGKASKGELIRTVFELDGNITKTDPVSRLFGGAMRFDECNKTDTSNASAYRYDQRNDVKQIKNNIFISNGLTWIEGTRKFYYIDSCAYDILEFDYDMDTGILCG